MKKTLMVFATVLLLCIIAQAQKAPKDMPGKLTTKQEAALKLLMNEMDQKFIEAFKGNEKLKNSMEADLKKLAEIKDKKLLKLQVTKYQDKYMADYGKIIKDGKIDLKYYVNKLQGIMPRYKFTLTNRYYITATLYDSVVELLPAPTLPVTTNLTEFHNESSSDCAFSSSSTTANSLESNSIAGLVETGCAARAKKELDIDVSNVKKATLSINYKAHIDVFVIAAFGTSSATADASISLANDVRESTTVCDLYRSVFSFLLWAAYEDADDDFTNRTFTIDLPVGKKYQLDCNTSANIWSMAISESNANSNIKEIKATLTTE